MHSSDSLSAVILAAGTSRRMGDRNKLLLEAGGRPVLAHVLAAVAGAPINEIIVVTGDQRERVAACVRRERDGGRETRRNPERRVRLVHNASFSSGMGASIGVGVQAASPSTAGIAICPGDLPFLSTETIEQLCRAFRTKEAPRIVAPICEGQQGHPVFFGASFREALVRRQGDRGARAVLQQNSGALTRVPVSSKEIRWDVDTPGALREARRRFRARTGPPT